MQKVFATIGGEVGISAAVSVVCQRLLSDPQLEPVFRPIDPVRLRNRMRGLFSAAFGGPDFEQSWEARIEHAGIRVDDRGFDRILDHVVGTIRALGVDSATLARMRTNFEGYRGVLTGREDSHPAG